MRYSRPALGGGAAPDLTGYVTDAELAAAVAGAGGGGNPVHLACAEEDLFAYASSQDIFTPRAIIKTDAEHFGYDPVGGYQIVLKTAGIYRVTGRINVSGIGFGFGAYTEQGGVLATINGGAAYSDDLENSITANLGAAMGDNIIESRAANGRIDLFTKNMNTQNRTITGRSSASVIGRALSYVLIERLSDVPA